VLPADFWKQPEIKSALPSQHFGHFLRTYRTIQSPHVTQTQLARWLGITQGQLSRIERSSTPVRDLRKLADSTDTPALPPVRARDSVDKGGLSTPPFSISLPSR
jgi:hypothetical protein